MTQAAVIFKDTDDGTEVGLDIPDIEQQDTMTPALFNATMISFIIEKGYHMQFKEEFLEEYERIQEEAKEESED